MRHRGDPQRARQAVRVITFDDFNFGIQKLREAFGPKGLENSRVTSVYQHCSDLTPEEWSQIVDEILDGNRYAPLPKEFKEKVAILKRSRKWSPIESQEQVRIECEDCYETGIVRVSDGGIAAWMFCHCDFGEKNHDYKLFNLPRWEKRLQFSGLPKMPFPLEWYPKNEKVDDVVFLKLTDFWRQEQSNAEAYWSGRKHAKVVQPRRLKPMNDHEYETKRIETLKKIRELQQQT